jgi:putative transposase
LRRIPSQQLLALNTEVSGMNARTKPKYSPAQQTLAIEHYLAHGRCIAATTKTLGYPSRDSLRAWIQAAHPQLCSQGVVRPDTSLSSQCVHICEKVLLRLMKQECLVAATPKRRRYGSYLGEISPAPENLVNRDFTAGAPNEKWLTDISEFHIPAGKVYLSPVIDCFDGKVVSWTISTRPDAQLVNTMLDAAIETIDISSYRPVVHSDRGAHYRWPGWLARIADAELTRSMSRKGCSPDNAACEGFFGRLKTEWFCSGNWQSTTVEQFTQALDYYIRWYNEKRIKMSLGTRSPLDYRQSLGLMA